MVLVVVVVATGCAGPDDTEPAFAGSSSDLEGPLGKLDDSSGQRAQDRGGRTDRPSTARRSPQPDPTPGATTRSEPQTRFLVSRVIDGDTLELGNGQDVRLVGIDTPEVGDCGYEKASENLAVLVEGKQVTLSRSDEDVDRYGRLLRHVNLGQLDAGLRLVENGLAIARYDSRDGYGFHPREPQYIAADRARPPFRCPAPPAPKPAPTAPTAPTAPAGCAEGYTPCVPPYPPDVDCPDVDGPIRVTGSDPHALDADGDGVACE